MGRPFLRYRALDHPIERVTFITGNLCKNRINQIVKRASWKRKGRKLASFGALVFRYKLQKKEEKGVD